jgi:adenosine deaminase
MSLPEARKLYKNDDDFIEALFEISTFSEDEKVEGIKNNAAAWSTFYKKLSNSTVLIYAKDIFVEYLVHIFKKFIDNGYQRVEFRAELVKLSEYDENGKFLRKISESEYPEYFEKAAKQVEEQFPDFSVGIIFGVRKSLPEEQLLEGIEAIFKLNWERVVGIDFIQEEDLYGRLFHYDQLVNRVAANYPEVRLWKCYHAGETKNPRSKNIEEAVLAGSARIGHGLNILQRVEFLPFCSHICFEKCPLSNLMLGYTGDPRESSAPILLGLGYAVSINMGDSGKLGAEDATPDFFVSAISYDWTFKHFKLIAMHSINHCLTRESHRRKIVKRFHEQWHEWVVKFIGGARNEEEV